MVLGLSFLLLRSEHPQDVSPQSVEPHTAAEKGALLSIESGAEGPHSHGGHNCQHCQTAHTALPQAVQNQLQVSSPTVAAFFEPYASGEPKWLDQSVFQRLANAERGDRIELTFPGFSVSGRVNTATRDEAFNRVGVELDEGLGFMTMGRRYDGMLSGFMVFNGQSRAFKFRGETASEWHIEPVSVGAIFCASANSSFPALEGSYRYSQPDYPRITPTSAVSFNQAAYSSLPGADYVLYLDFDGESVSGTSWNTIFNNGNPIVSPPHPKATSDEFVRAVWARTSEDFVPFELNVTTDRAVFNAADPAKRLMAIITPDQSWLSDDIGGNIGGIASDIGAFGNGEPCYTFNLSEFGAAETFSHEIGHMLGLFHDSVGNDPDDVTNQYFFGHGAGETSWAPIMGVSDFVNVSQWSQGEYDGAIQWDFIEDGQNPARGRWVQIPIQDDLEVIMANGFGYRGDDTGDTTASAETLTTFGLQINQEGIVETTSDIDFYEFEADSAGVAVFTANPFDPMSQAGEFDSDRPAANLAIELKVYDAGGTELDVDNPFNQMGAELNYVIPSPGTYYISVQGVGRGNPAIDGFSPYASLGQYKLTGSLPLGPLTVLGGASADQVIQSGDSTPSETDGTFFGQTDLRTQTTLTRQFDLENTGLSVLQINQITSDSSGFAVQVGASLINPSSTETITLAYTPSGSTGRVQGTVTIEYIELSDPGNVREHIFVVEAIVSKTDLDDNYEDNDFFNEAYPLAADTNLSDILGPALQADNDWYVIEVLPGFNEITVAAIDDFLGGQVSVALYDPRGYLIFPQDSEAQVNFFTQVVDEAGGSYRLRVYGDNSGAEYDLNWSAISPIASTAGVEDNYEDNDYWGRSGSFNIGAIRDNGSLQDIDGLATQLDNDWYRLPISSGDNQITINLTQLNTAGEISMQLYNDRGGSVTEELFGGIVTYVASYEIDEYYLKVIGDNGGAIYDIAYSSTYIAPEVIPDDNYEDNDNWGEPFDLREAATVPLASVNGTGRQLDNDWYRMFSPDGFNRITVEFDPDGVVEASTDLILSIYDTRGYLVSQVSAPNSGAFLTVRTELGPGYYYVSVIGDGLGSEYDFVWSYGFAPAGDDIYEDNDTLATAYDLTDQKERLLSEIAEPGLQGDEDWYKVSITGAEGIITVEASDFDMRDGTLNFWLTDDTGEIVAATSYFRDVTDTYFESASIRFEAEEAPGPGNTVDYYIWVDGQDRGNSYDLFWDADPLDDNYEENDFVDEAFEIPTSRSGDLETLDGLAIQADDDWYVFEVPFGARTILITLDFLGIEGDIDLALYDQDFNLLALSLGIGDVEEVFANLDDEDEFLYALAFLQDTGNEYNMTWSFDGVTSGDADMDWIGDGWERQHASSIHELSANMNPDGDSFPLWAEYALYLDPSEMDVGIVSSYVEDGYQYVSFKRNREAFDAGYSFAVVESEDLAFGQVNYSVYESAVNMGDYDLVTYRSSQPITDHSSCFFKVLVDRPAVAH